MEEIYGKQVLPALAEQFRQLYLLPGRDAPLYKKALQGQTPTGADLSHFVMDDRDSIIIEDTPAGSVPVVTLHDRSAFETFLRCMVYRCELAYIPASQGAAMISGIIDRQKIAALREGYLKEHPGDMMGWIRRFEEIRTDKRAVTSDMVVLSYGAYSGFVPEGHTEDEWLSLSMTIRKYHECTHFIVHRLYHHEKDGLFDELMADTVGIYAALGMYDM
ncbi:MAG: hypothetical protein IKR73_01795, partial [Oscillospiraceae bacterium]|nr:hypothetical protein [Oscillospiraceae bacterium]